MGKFINVGNKRYEEAIRNDYVDKTELIAGVNRTLCTESRMSCVTRCRRFGKSMAATMLRAYYDKSCDSRKLFQGLAIEKDPSFETHLNKYPVIYLDLTYFISLYGHDQNIVEKIKRDLMEDIYQEYPNVPKSQDDNPMSLVLKIAKATGYRFFMIIDEWDAICREFKESSDVMDRYVDFLRLLFKGPLTEEVFVGAYITGILPIKKYNTQSSLNNFREYTMLMPGKWAKHYGFTSDEVKSLCEKNGMDYEEMKRWYDGYQIGTQPSMFNPNSVMTAIGNGCYGNYWSATGAIESISNYIHLNFEGLKDSIINMISGGAEKVDYGRFSNDINMVKNRDDVLTVLIHLGYLAYNPLNKTCFIPNLEVREEMIRAIEENKSTPATSSWLESTMIPKQKSTPA